MKQKMVMTENVKAVSNLIRALKDRPQKTPGLGLIYGTNGRGKTEVVLWELAKNSRHFYVRVNAIMTAKTILAKLLFELGEMPLYKTTDMYDKLLEILAKQQYLFFIDEVDYCMHNIKALEVLRDIQDETGTIFVLVGMENVERKLRRYGHIRSRIMEVVKIQDLSVSDVEKAIEELLDLTADEKVIEKIHELAKGSFRNLIVILNKVEKIAKLNKEKAIRLEYLRGI